MDNNISKYINADGTIDASKLSELRQLVEEYPFFHAARILLIRLLYQLHDSSYSSELRRAALFLPSREAIFQLVEEQQFKPKQEKEPVLSGATVARKASSHLETHHATPAQRTETLITGFLNTLPSDNTPSTPADRRRARPIDASQDYMGFLLQQEELQRRQAAQQAARQSQETAHQAQENEGQMQESVRINEKMSAEQSKKSARSEDLMEHFIKETGDKRIRLQERENEELQKPVLINENTSGQGAFTEALARIYIKQGKFDHAIEIIHRLSLKYPKKNSYFADQIRFLEKLLENQRFNKQ